jgi:hypothetical protein
MAYCISIKYDIIFIVYCCWYMLYDTDGSALWDWLKFLAVRKEAELKMRAEETPQIAQAVARLQELSDDERTRWLAESREKMEWDNAARMHAAEERGLGKCPLHAA